MALLGKPLYITVTQQHGVRHEIIRLVVKPDGEVELMNWDHRYIVQMAEERDGLSAYRRPATKIMVSHLYDRIILQPIPVHVRERIEDEITSDRSTRNSRKKREGRLKRKLKIIRADQPHAVGHESCGELSPSPQGRHADQQPQAAPPAPALCPRSVLSSFFGDAALTTPVIEEGPSGESQPA